MKLLAPIAAVIAAASAGQIYAGQSAESYVNSAEIYQSALEHQQNGLYSSQSLAPQMYEATYNSRPSGEKIAKILSYKMEDNGHQYMYSYETENGIHAQENGKTAEHGTAAQGAYSYTGDDGKVYTVTYTADENGFHPQGEHLPTPPPIPEEILKGLEQNAREEAAGIHDDGKYRQESGHSSSQGSGYASNSLHQFNGKYQSLGYQASSDHQSAAELAYRGQAGQAFGAQLAYHGQAAQDSGAKLAYYSQTSGPELAYRGHANPTSGDKLAYLGQGSELGNHGQAIQVSGLSGHAGEASGADLAYQGYSSNAGQHSLGKIVVSSIGTDGNELGYAKH